MVDFLRYRKLIHYLSLAFFVVLLVTQFCWLRYAWKVKERELDTKLQVALSVLYRQEAKAGILLSDMAKGANDGQKATSTSFKLLHNLLDSILRKNDLPLNYVASIGNTYDPELWISDTAYPKQFANNPVKQYLRADADSKDLWCLTVNFTDKTGYLLSAITPYLLVCLFSILLLLFCYISVMIVIKRQVALAKLRADVVNNMFHELAIPLTTLSTTSDTLKDQPVINKDSLQGIRQQISHLNHLLEIILSHSQPPKK
ncbi:MAG: hypothetical protein QM731_01155 [Chitinophagaceae bacterium]